MALAKVFQLSADALGTEFVAIGVGPKRKTFAVHKKLLCDRSDFFSKAFNGKFKEATDGVMYLLEDDADAFDSMIVYIYQDVLPAFPRENCTAEHLKKAIYPLFALAEKLCLNELANRLMDLIQDVGMKYNLIPGIGLGGGAYIIYAITQYALAAEDVQGDNITEGKLLAELAHHHPDFAKDYFELLWKYRARFHDAMPLADARALNSEEGFGRCFFHTHHENEVCHLDLEATD